jgi:hypothetical protein
MTGYIIEVVACNVCAGNNTNLCQNYAGNWMVIEKNRPVTGVDLEADMPHNYKCIM